MSTNILELLKSEFGDEIVGQLGKFVGEDAAKTKSALGSIFPAVVGALINKGSTSQGASEILDRINRGGFGEDALKAPENAFAGGYTTTNLLNIGTNLLGWIFGDRVAKVTDWICAPVAFQRTPLPLCWAWLCPPCWDCWESK